MLVEHELSLGVPCVDVSAQIVRDDLDPPVTEQIASGERSEHRAGMVRADAPIRRFGAVQRQLRRVNRPAGKLRAVGPERVHRPVRGGEHQLIAVLAVQVDQQRARGAVGLQFLGPARQHVLVAMEVQLPAVLPGHRRPRSGRSGAHQDPRRECVRLRVGEPVGGLREPAVLVAVEALDIGGEHRLELGGAELGDRPAEWRVVDGAPVAIGRADVREVARRRVGCEPVVRLGSRGDLDLARIAAAGVHVAPERDLRPARVQLLEPVGRGDVRLGRDRAVLGGGRGLVCVQAAVAVELVEPPARRVAAGVGRRAVETAIQVGRECRVVVGVGAGRSRGRLA